MVELIAVYKKQNGRNELQRIQEASADGLLMNCSYAAGQTSHERY